MTEKFIKNFQGDLSQLRIKLADNGVSNIFATTQK